MRSRGVRLAFLTALVVAFFFVQAHAKQDVTVNIEAKDIPKSFLNQEPIKIVGLYIGQKRIDSGIDVLANADWLRDFRVVVKNVSDQGIKEINLYLTFPTGDETIGDRLFDLHWGRLYFRDPEGARAADNSIPDTVLLPGESTSITLPPGFYDAIKEHLAHGHEKSYIIPNKGMVRLDTAVFEDGDHAWHAPRFYVRSGNKWQSDPNRPYNLVRPDSKLQGLVKKVGANTPSSRTTCYDYVGVVEPSPWCSSCSSCKYPKHDLQIVSPPQAWKRKLDSYVCYQVASTPGNPILYPLVQCVPNCCHSDYKIDYDNFCSD